MNKHEQFHVNMVKNWIFYEYLNFKKLVFCYGRLKFGKTCNILISVLNFEISWHKTHQYVVILWAANQQFR